MASSSPPEAPLSPNSVYLRSSSPPPGFTFSSTPPGPISSSSPSWSDGSTTTVSTVELELSEGDSCDTDHVFTRRLTELLSDVERHRQEEDSKESCADAHPRGFINTFQATFDLRALSFSTSSTGTEIDADIESDPVSCTSFTSFDCDTEINAPSFLELSPIVFAPSSSQSSPLPRIHSPINRNAKPGFSSRLIHRASSYFCPRSDLDKEEENDSEPPRKRPKILTRTSTHTHLRTNLAKTSASVRRAASLRSVLDDDKENAVPTAPASPSSTLDAHGSGAVCSKNTKNKCTDERMEVPAIAPPSPLPPMSTESPARLRIRRFVERERELRAQDGLGIIEGKTEDKWLWDCVGEDLRQEVVRWFMQVLSPEKSEEYKAAHRTEGSEDGDDTCTVVNSPSSVSITSSVSSSCASSRSFTTSSTTTSATTRTTTTSPTSIRSSPCSITSPSSASSSPTVTTTPNRYYRSDSCHTHERSPCRTNLADQLSTSPETRFHAAYLFMRFFWLVGLSGEGSGASSAEGETTREVWAFGSELDKEGRRLVTWDVGLACLGISIKYHRDFLYPLLPIYAHELMKMAPHGPVGYEDLETAHRDVLNALQFRLGDTPQGVLGEVWEAVPVLRRILNSEFENACGCRCRCKEKEGEEGKSGCREGWNLVQRETWRTLCVAVLEPDVLKYPLSLLAASALLHGSCVVLMRRDEDAKPWYMYELCVGSGSPVSSSKWRRDTEARAERTVGAVKKELVELMDLDEVKLEGCRTWLRRVLDV